MATYRIIKRDGNYYPERKELFLFKKIYVDGIAFNSKNIEDSENVILKEIELLKKQKQNEEYAKERVVKTFNKSGIVIKNMDNIKASIDNSFNEIEKPKI